VTLEGRELMVAIKQGRSGHYELAVEGFPTVRLRAINTSNPSANDVARLTEWRNRHVRSFLTEFHATEARTRHWLTSSVSSDDSRVLFMIEDRNGPIIGYVGLAFIDWAKGYAEADSVVRGDDAFPGIMSAALKALVGWGRDQLKLSSYGVRVLSDNPALRFYEKHGFQERRRAPLTSEKYGEGVAWKEMPGGAGGRQLVYMELVGS
jgi:RimJ/RimL family protein N-acetyltransferase